MVSQACTEDVAQNAMTTSKNKTAETSVSRLPYSLPAKWHSALDEDVSPAGFLLRLRKEPGRPPRRVRITEAHGGSMTASVLPTFLFAILNRIFF